MENLETKKKRQTVDYSKGQSKSLSFLYKTTFGRFCLKLLVKPNTSKLAGKYMNTKLSTIHIKRFVKKNNIDLSEYEARKFKSYNDFFTRKILEGKRIVDMDKNAFIAPCDSKLSAFKIDNSSTFKIKDSYYTICDLLGENEIYKNYTDGLCLIFRLATNDYHRYCYVDNGTKEKNTYIPGEFHTVQPIALDKYNIYKRNAREYTLLHTNSFDDIVQVEVGAMMIGKIKNHHMEHTFKKGEEKGYFEFGGSTIVLLIKKNVISLDNEIIENTKLGLETIVKYGEKIGEKYDK